MRTWMLSLLLLLCGCANTQVQVSFFAEKDLWVERSRTLSPDGKVRAEWRLINTH